MAERLHLDFETRSACDLKSAGAYRYSIHETTQVTHMGYRFDREPIEQWKPGMPFPLRVAMHVADCGVVVCHNAGFERRIWNNALTRQVFDVCLSEMLPEQQSCTLARALILSYPDDLEQLAIALGIDVAKDMKGRALMLKYSKPIRYRTDLACEFATPSPEDERLIDIYNINDVVVEARVDDLLPELSAREREIWLLDQRINDRGVPIDVHEVKCADALASAAKRMADREMRDLTAGMVQRSTEAAQIVTWLRGRGIDATSAAEFELSQLDLSSDDKARRVVELRTFNAKSSTAKFAKMLACVGPDGRLRDQYAYAKANTARWAGRLVQLQNLKRLNAKKDGEKFKRIFEAFDAFGLNGEESFWYVHLVTGAPVLDTLAKSLRRFIKAPEGKFFCGGDFSNVEGRFNAWVAGEDWKIEAFKLYDAKMGPDLYMLAYSRSFGKDLNDIAEHERQIGKVQELALGYQGGVHAYLSMGPNYGVRPGDIMPVVKAATPPELWQQFVDAYPTARDKHGLLVDCWAAIKILVRSFRLQNPKIAKSWFNLQDAAVKAVDNPGELVSVPEYRGISYLFQDATLWCKLPSNRLMAYAQPSVVTECNDSLVWSNGHIEDAATYTSEDIKMFVEMGAAQLIERKPRRQVRFWGKVEGKWRPKRLYGGLQCENIVQASCRDFQADALLRLENANYPVIFHTHDDIVSECDIGTGSEDEFRQLMAQESPWAPGMPLAVATWSGTRYGK